MSKSKIAALALATGVSVAACTSVPAGEVAVMVDSVGAPEITGCQGPETWKFTPFSDAFRYSSRQIQWDTTGGPNAQAQPTVVVSRADAPAELRVPFIVTMDMTTDCDKLKIFHRDFGMRYPKDFNGLLRYVIGVPAEQTVITLAQKYPWRDIWNNEKVRAEFQEALRTGLPEASKARTNGQEYFTNFQVTVMKPDPVDPELKAAISKEQAAVANARADQARGVAEAEAKKAAAEADVAAAKAQTIAAEEEAKRRAAEISGWPSAEDYLRNEAIKRGLNPYQPVIVPGMP